MNITHYAVIFLSVHLILNSENAQSNTLAPIDIIFTGFVTKVNDFNQNAEDDVSIGDAVQGNIFIELINLYNFSDSEFSNSYQSDENLPRDMFANISINNYQFNVNNSDNFIILDNNRDLSEENNIISGTGDRVLLSGYDIDTLKSASVTFVQSKSADGSNSNLIDGVFRSHLYSIDSNETDSISGIIQNGVSYNVEYLINPSSVSINGSAPTGPSIVGNPNGGYSLNGAFDFNKPTIIVTHGWQDRSDDEYTGSVNDTAFSASMYAELTDEYGSDVNILVFTWEDAFQIIDSMAIGITTAKLAAARKAWAGVPEASYVLSGLLVDLMKNVEIGEVYDQPIHFIGHSLGNLVNAGAAMDLAAGGIVIDHVTMLEAPTQVFAKQQYVDLATTENIGYVENLIGEGLFAFGSEIPGIHTYTFENADHSTVWERYVETISGSNIDGHGFDYSAVLGEAAFNSRPTDTGSTEWNVVSTNPIWYDTLFHASSFGTQTSTLEIHQESDGFAILGTILPEGVDTLKFDLEFTQPGDGDWLEVLFDDILILAILAETFPAGPQTIYADVSQFGGTAGYFSFILRSVGELAASVRITDMQFLVATSGDVNPVPLPPSLALFVTALAGMGLFGWRKKRHPNMDMAQPGLLIAFRNRMR